MLSRVAENIYWMARYLERAEDTARMINSMSSLLLDLPRNVEVGWDELVKVIGAEAQFNEFYPDKDDERSVIRFLTSDMRNPSSILACIKAVRENARVTRDIIPNEVWEQANELYYFASEQASSAASRRKRNHFMSHLIRRCQTMIGTMMGTIPHDDAYQFLRIGRNLERAEMSSRILDVAAANLLSEEEEFNPAFATVRWINVLKSLNAFQAYRREGYIGVNAKDVLNYLLNEQEFPRSMGHCLKSVGECLSALPNPRSPRRHLNQLIRQLNEVNTNRIKRSGLHRFIDGFQIGIARIHTALTNTYFRSK